MTIRRKSASLFRRQLFQNTDLLESLKDSTLEWLKVVQKEHIDDFQYFLGGSILFEFHQISSDIDIHIYSEVGEDKLTLFFHDAGFQIAEPSAEFHDLYGEFTTVLSYHGLIHLIVHETYQGFLRELNNHKDIVNLLIQNKGLHYFVKSMVARSMVQEKSNKKTFEFTGRNLYNILTDITVEGRLKFRTHLTVP